MDVGALDDRVLRDWLLGGADQPLRAPLTGSVDASATTLPVDVGKLGPDEQDAFAAGTAAEVGREQVWLTDVDLDAGEIEVVRAMNGTTATAHGAGDFVLPQPAYWRESIFQAVADQIVALYPRLYAVVTDPIVQASPYTEIAAEAMVPLAFRWLHNGSLPIELPHPQMWRDFPDSATGVALFLPGVPAGAEGWFTYRAKFPRPDGEADTLAALGVDEAWAEIVVVGAVATVLSGAPETEPLTSEWIAKQLEREAVPIGTSGSLAARLFRLRDRLIEDAQRSLRARDPHPTGFDGYVPLVGGS